MLEEARFAHLEAYLYLCRDNRSQELKVIRTCRWQRIWTQGPSDRALD